MTVNHAGILKKEFFLAYLRLVLSSRASSVREAKELTFQLFFHQDETQFGHETYEQFILAYEELLQQSGCCYPS